MTIKLDPELKTRLAAMAKASGATVEDFALEVLRRSIMPKVWLTPPRDEFERILRTIGTPCGAVLSDEDLSRASIYD